MAYSDRLRTYLHVRPSKRKNRRDRITDGEVLHQNLAEIEASDIHKRLGLEKGKYICSVPRERRTCTEQTFSLIPCYKCNARNMICLNYKAVIHVAVIVSTSV
jgi:hypothetical protein